MVEGSGATDNVTVGELGRWLNRVDKNLSEITAEFSYEAAS